MARKYPQLPRRRGTRQDEEREHAQLVRELREEIRQSRKSEVRALRRPSVDPRVI